MVTKKVIKSSNVHRVCAIIYYKGEIFTSSEHADLLYNAEVQLDNPYDTDEDTIDLFPDECIIGTIHEVEGDYIFELIRGSNKALLKAFIDRIKLPIYRYKYSDSIYVSHNELV